LNNKNILIHRILNWYNTNNVINYYNFQSNESFGLEKDKNNTLEYSSNNLGSKPNETSFSKQGLNELNDLDSLRKQLEVFDGCALKKTATNLVFSDGNEESKVMLIGEAPGEEEDKTGKPFKGQAGKLLDKMLDAIGQNRDNTYITNLIFWRPPGNRNPSVEEIDACLPFVLRHIELINPKILILAGAIAAKAILKENNKGIIQLRGKWQNFSLNKATIIKTMPIYHPSFLLRQPSRKRDAWEDLKKIKKEIDLIT
jgi:DNA polymerase|tara:strand:- start:234 stop:1001 length:768 start_codon:yes stop_codon:yes gene_type:complete